MEYRFPVSGNFLSPKETKEYTSLLEQNLEYDLKDWFLFPESNKLIDRIVFDVDGRNGDVGSISLYTNEELLGDNTQALRDCIEKNMLITGQQYYQTADLAGKVAITHGVMAAVYEPENKEDDFTQAVNNIPALGPVLE